MLAVHLVRSLYERGSGAGRNGCEVTFEEDLEIPIGGEEVEMRRRDDAVEEEVEDGERFRLMSVVTHKGGHDSGHYICYRRRKRERRVKKRERKGSISTKEKVEQTVETEVVEGEDSGEEQGVQVEQVDSRTKWWEISDEVVWGVDREDVLNKRKGVYILFYEKAS